MSTEQPNGTYHAQINKILWWIITILLGLTSGAGSSWITRLDGMYQLKADVRTLTTKVEELTGAVNRKGGGQ